MAQRKRENSTQQSINYLIKKGIDSLVESHPIFGNFQEYIASHINQEGIIDTFNSVYETVLEKTQNQNAARKAAYSAVENYIISGNLLDEAGKKVILEGGLKDKTNLFRKVFHRELPGEKYLNNTIKTFKGLQELLASGDYAVRNQEMANAVSKLTDAEFHYAAARILKEGGFINEKEEQKMLRTVYNRLSEYPEKAVGELKKNIYGEDKEGKREKLKIAYRRLDNEPMELPKENQLEEKVQYQTAAAVIGFLGMMLMLFNIEITGAVIGENSPVGLGIVGVFMIILGMLMYLRPFKKILKK